MKEFSRLEYSTFYLALEVLNQFKKVPVPNVDGPVL
jgi:hypothetical protein